MKVYLIYFLLTLISFLGMSQKLEYPEPEMGDTIIVRGYYNKYDLTSYKAIKIEQRSKMAFRFEGGYTFYSYDNKTAAWLGSAGSANLNFIGSYDNISLGLKFKLATITPQKELIFNNVVLTNLADLNPVKIDYFISYSLDYDPLISIEPYIGFTQSVFEVINEEELNQKYSIQNSFGPIAGITLNKYFLVRKYSYIAIFGTMGYGFVDFKRTHPDLGYGYLEYTIGIAYKRFGNKIVYKKIE